MSEFAPHSKDDESGERSLGSPLLPWLWPLISAASISRIAATGLEAMAKTLAGDGAEFQANREMAWATPHHVALELPSVRLRDFSQSETGHGTIICAPLALHGAVVADFAPGHSLVERLRHEGQRRLFVTDWRSATADMQSFTIDSYLADLNVAVDDCGPPVSLVGLCQGGWLALAYAARFPTKVRKLVLAGSPIDIAAGSSSLSELATMTPLSTFKQLVELGKGRMLGCHMLEIWKSQGGSPDEAERVLQVPEGHASDELRHRFRSWCAAAIDLPGRYYLQVVQQIFKENQISRGQFVALGRQIHLEDVRVPMALLAGHSDDVANERQVFSAAHLVGTPAGQIIKLQEPCGHLSLFMGARTLGHAWAKIGRWLNNDSVSALAS